MTNSKTNPQQLAILACFLVMMCSLVSFAQETDVRELKPNQIIEREMTGKETHRYKFDLKRGEFFQVRVEQKGVDVMLRIVDADGVSQATMDSPNSKEGPEILSFIADAGGKFVLEISGFDEKGKKEFICSNALPHARQPIPTKDGWKSKENLSKG